MFSRVPNRWYVNSIALVVINSRQKFVTLNIRVTLVRVEMMITFTQHVRFSPIFSEVRTLNVRVTLVRVEMMMTFTQHLRFSPIFSQVHVAEYFMLCLCVVLTIVHLSVLWQLYCLYFHIQHLINPLSFDNCIVCTSPYII